MPRPGEWQHKWRQLEIRKKQLLREIDQVEAEIGAGKKGATLKINPLKAQLRTVQNEINKILEANA